MATTTTNDVATRIVNALYLSDPEIDTTIGTPIRKIIDAVSEQIALATNDSFIMDYQYDVDSKSAGDLDDFVANFGMARLPGQRATGIVTFSRSADAASKSSVTIPVGTAIVAKTLINVTAITTVNATMNIKQTSVDVPVMAAATGPDGNVLAGNLSTILTPPAGISSVTNKSPLSGGTDPETDPQLKARFKSSVFRNLAGSDAMYRGIALGTLVDPTIAGSYAVSQVNVIGPTQHWSEVISVTGTGAISSTILSAAYIYSGSVTIRDATGARLVNLVNFTKTVTNPAPPTLASMSVTPVDNTVMPIGLYTLEFDYVPSASRNDPEGARFSQGVVNNRVDVIVNGTSVGQATQNAVYAAGVVFSATSTDPLYNNKFVASDGVTHPTVGHHFIPLGFGPILSIPGTLIIGSTTYTLGTHYDYVQQDDAFGYAPNSLYGIWWKTTAPSPTSFPITYNYNQVPLAVAKNINNWRLLGTDAQVHGGKIAFFQLNFAVVYLPTSSITTVNSNLTSVISQFVSGLGFDSSLQVSDVLQVAHNVAGVDNIRFTTSADPEAGTGHYGIENVNLSGGVITRYEKTSNTPKTPTDANFDDRTYPQIANLVFNVRAKNNFMTGA